MARGKFITFEGGEGTGKSTQLRLLAKRLRALGHDVVETREPGGTPGAEIVRDIIKTGAVEQFGPFAEAVMLTAARDDHVTHVIRPALEGGSWVLCDRFTDSTRAYQGAAGGVDPEILTEMERIAVGDTVPELTVLLDAPPELGLARAKARATSSGSTAPDRFEKEEQAFHAKLRDALLEIAHAEPQRCIVIDANRTKTQVAEDIWAAVVRRLKV